MRFEQLWPCSVPTYGSPRRVNEALYATPFGRSCGLAHQRAQVQGRERSASAVTAARLAPFLRRSFSRRWARSMVLSTSITQSRTSSQTSWITAMLVPELGSTLSRRHPPGVTGPSMASITSARLISSAARASTYPPWAPRMLSTSPALRRSAMICSRKPSGISARSAITRTWTGWLGAPLMERSSMALIPYSHLAEKIISPQSYRPCRSERLLERSSSDLAQDTRQGPSRHPRRHGLSGGVSHDLGPEVIQQGGEAAPGLALGRGSENFQAPTHPVHRGRAVAQGQAQRGPEPLQRPPPAVADEHRHRDRLRQAR